MANVAEPPQLESSIVGIPEESAGDARLTRLLGTRIAALTFAGIVFITTTVQVVANPLAALLSVGAQWTNPLPLPVAALVTVVACAAQSACLLLTTRHPGPAVFGTVACYLAVVVLLAVPTWVTAMQFVIAIALFLFAAQSTLRSAVASCALTTAAVLTSFSLWSLSFGAPSASASAFVLGQVTLFFAPAAGATALGMWWGVRSRRVERADAQAKSTAREQEERITRARIQERARIAQELHDVAAQHIAGLLSLADAAIDIEVRAPDEALRLIEDIRTEGRFASASLYAALRELRAVDGERAERTPDLRSVAELSAYWRQRGMALETHTSEDVRELPAVVSTSAYRGVQESLTNAAKHAAGSAVRADITVTDGWLQISVENGPPRVPHPTVETIGLGWGLEGLEQRLRLLSGTVDAGPTAEGGWRVRMEIPVLEIEAPSSLTD